MIVMCSVISFVGLDYAASPVINPFIYGFEAKGGFVWRMVVSQLVC